MHTHKYLLPSIPCLIIQSVRAQGIPHTHHNMMWKVYFVKMHSSVLMMQHIGRKNHVLREGYRKPSHPAHEFVCGGNTRLWTFICTPWWLLRSQTGAKADRRWHMLAVVQHLAPWRRTRPSVGSSLLCQPNVAVVQNKCEQPIERQLLTSTNVNWSPISMARLHIYVWTVQHIQLHFFLSTHALYSDSYS